MSLDVFLDKICKYCQKDEKDCKCCDKCHDPLCGICKGCKKTIICGYYCISCAPSGKDLNGWWHKDIWHGM